MIPARMGSTRVPKKNIRYLGDKPLINYPIELALKSGLFDDIYINTESEELGRYAKSLGVLFYKRPEILSSNTATNREFMYDFLKNVECDYVIMLNPTSPLVSQNSLNDFYELISGGEYDTVMTVVSEKTECFYKEKPVNFDLSVKINSQLLEPVHRVVWAMTGWKRSTFIHNQENGINPIFGGKIGLYNIRKDESCDIDTEQDWNEAEGGILRKETAPKYLNLDDYKNN